MIVREASCRCGALKAYCRGEPVRVSVCHCLACKRHTGSAFSYNATYPAERVDTHGPSASFTSVGDEGRWARFSFCPGCGSTVFYEIEMRPGMISVPVGGFANPDFPAPRFSVYEERKHGWFDFSPGQPIERMD